MDYTITGQPLISGILGNTFYQKKKKKKEQKLGIIETWIWVIFTLLYWKISPDDYMQPILLSAISIQSLLFNM